MKPYLTSRRRFLGNAGALAGGTLLSPSALFGRPNLQDERANDESAGAADYALTIATTPIELAPDRARFGLHL